MQKVTVCVDLDDDKYRAYVQEAERRGTTVESLLKHAIYLMFLDHEERMREEQEDHPIHIS
jgi:hypothetical protein